MTTPNTPNFSDKDIATFLNCREDFEEYLKAKSLPANEYKGMRYAKQIQEYITKSNGRFLRDDKGCYHALIGNRRIPLVYADDNHALADLLLKACNITMVSSVARVAVQRITNTAWQGSSRLAFKQFSAISKDEQKRSSVYIPISTGELLCIGASGWSVVPNGDNEAKLWLEHPTEDPLAWTSLDRDRLSIVLRDFERLLVDTQACAVAEMRWFVAMAEGLFPFVRDAHLNRLIVVHRGGSQSGKTSGSQRFTKLHGLGAVKGDYSVAALRNMLDIGLLVLDNREQANFTQPLIDYCLFLATGGEHGRSNQDGSLRTHGGCRPVGVITTIEGVPKTELQRRCVNVDYQVPEGAERLRREPIESEITRLRHEMLSALVFVLTEYLAFRHEYIDTPNPIPEFEEHFTTLCYLLRAYSQVAQKPKDWAENIISVWAKTLDKSADPDDGGDWEEVILWLLRDGKITAVKHRFEHNGASGVLYVTEAMPVLNALQQTTRLVGLPTHPNGLSRRLRTMTMKRCVVLTQDDSDSPVLKRQGSRRPLAFFVAGEV